MLSRTKPMWIQSSICVAGFCLVCWVILADDWELTLERMALLTHQLQGSCATFTSRPSWTKGIKLKHHVETLHMVGRTHRCCLLKSNCLCEKAPRARVLKGKPIKISGFKGNVQSDESGGRTSASKSMKNLAESVSHPHSLDTSDVVKGSTTVHNLFKKWLTMLRTQSPDEAGAANEIIDEGLPQIGVSETQNGTPKKARAETGKVFLSYLLGLDAIIKIPLLIFIPCFLVVNLVYGAEVSKELTPFWIMGPLIVALYVKIFWGIFGLYVFSFKQMVKVINNLPTYYHVASSYIAHGKLKGDFVAHIWQPLVDMGTHDYKEASKVVREWIFERYLDFIEMIWPSYSRLIRFFKRANFI